MTFDAGTSRQLGFAHAFIATAQMKIVTWSEFAVFRGFADKFLDNAIFND